MVLCESPVADPVVSMNIEFKKYMAIIINLRCKECSFTLSSDVYDTMLGSAAVYMGIGDTNLLLFACAIVALRTGDS